MNPALMRTGRLAVLAAMTLLLAACAWLRGEPAAPLFRLTPASLGRELTVVQRMDVAVAGQHRSLDVALEVDPDAVRLAVMQLGQTIARLDWDGRTLSQTLAPGWPKVVSAERVLSDLQMVWWPADTLRAALPPGWRLFETARGRTFFREDNPVVTVRLVEPGHIELIQGAEGYTVQLHSQGASPAFAEP
ncbi:DUF3261 domain-containing protein [Aquabacterium sp.]|uniref:DUF3261 domain-containing protein n=1 Tax=Aquabacterium sp. TaxID=1872578 RepID=UPI003D6CFC33